MNANSPQPTDRGAYSPVITSENGTVQVQLTADHPGFSDETYRERRNAIAQLSLHHRVGDPVPEVHYTDGEHEVWSIVARELEVAHEKHACDTYLIAKEKLALPHDYVPQLDEVSRLLSPLSNFRYEPVPGLAPLREFYGAFSSRVFFSTQYIRHPSVPKYTPEPDIIHEVVGHANQLADPDFASIYVAVGEAVARTQSADALEFLSRVFWFTMEFGVVYQSGVPKAYGAGILSSIGELDVFQAARIEPLDLRAMGSAQYDITHYQPVLYSFESLAALHDELQNFYTSFDDDVWARLTTNYSRS